MTRPVQVTFRNMAVSSEVEQEARARATWLETFYPGLIGCRVLIEVPHRHRTKGRPIHVRIELSLPGEDVVVTSASSRQATPRHSPPDTIPTEARITGVHPDVIVAVHEAFDLARRRLEDYARRQRGEVKGHTLRA